MTIIGIPVSIASFPVWGNEKEFEHLLSEILKREKGLILGLNFRNHFLQKKVVNMRTLPTIVMENDFSDFRHYLNEMRHSYRRRMHRISQKFNNVITHSTLCSQFSENHYQLYLDVMKRSRTKIETLSFDFFRQLPDNFLLTTHYLDTTILAWHICTSDQPSLYFFMGGINYPLRDEYSSYYNNLFSIVEYALINGFKKIDLGQTAEIAKLRLGGTVSERNMFLYHRNLLLLLIFRVVKPFIEYSVRHNTQHVFKQGSNSILQ